MVKDCHDNGLFIFSWGEISESSCCCLKPFQWFLHVHCLPVTRQPRQQSCSATECDLNGAIMSADNDPAMYNRQKKAGVDAIIMDDVAKLTKVSSCSILSRNPGERLQVGSDPVFNSSHLPRADHWRLSSLTNVLLVLPCAGVWQAGVLLQQAAALAGEL